MRRVIFITLILIFSVVLFVVNKVATAAEQYPQKPIVFVVPTEAGGAGDILVRPLCQIVSETLGKPIMIVNKPGAGTTLGNLEIYNAKPDGYVIGLGLLSLITSNLAGVSRLHFSNFTHMGSFYTMYFNVFGSTRTKRPFKTIEEVISFAKSHPKELSLASASKGSADWVGAVAFLLGTGIDVNVIPQAGGGGLTVVQIAGGHADLAAINLAAAKSQLDAGNIRFLAVMGPQRDPAYPDIPTLRDLGYDVVWESSGFIIGPPNMPKDVTNKLTEVFEMAANNPKYHEFLRSRLAMPVYLPPDKTVDLLDRQSKMARDIMQKAGILKEK